MIIRESVFQETGDLFRGPVGLKLLGNQFPELRVQTKFASLGPFGSREGPPIGGGCPVFGPAEIPVDLPGDGRGSSPEASGKTPDRFTACDPARDLLAFTEGQRQAAPVALSWSDATGLYQLDVDRPLGPFEGPPDRRR